MFRLIHCIPKTGKFPHILYDPKKNPNLLLELLKYNGKYAYITITDTILPLNSNTVMRVFPFEINRNNKVKLFGINAKVYKLKINNDETFRGESVLNIEPFCIVMIEGVVLPKKEVTILVKIGINNNLLKNVRNENSKSYGILNLSSTTVHPSDFIAAENYNENNRFYTFSSSKLIYLFYNGNLGPGKVALVRQDKQSDTIDVSQHHGIFISNNI